MEIQHSRDRNNGQTTIGTILVNWGEWSGVVLEDGPHRDKIPGQTRIPAGIYEVGFLNIMTPLTQHYRKKYPWFRWHLEIKNIPNFSRVYYHIGNDHEDTEGCPLLGTSVSVRDEWFIVNSTAAYKQFYELVSEALIRGERVTNTIIDELI